MDLSFAEAVWLLCPAFLLHVIEERPAFTTWAQRHASKRYTQRDYDRVHAAGIASTFVVALAASAPNHTIVLMLFALSLGPSLLWNVLFHVGASILTRRYCPGVITAVLFNLPLFFLLTWLALTEHLTALPSFLAILALAGVLHAWEVGHNVFKVW